MPSTISRHRSLLGNPPPKALGVRRSYLIGVGTDMLGSDVVGTVVGIMFGIWVGSLAHSLTHAPMHPLTHSHRLWSASGLASQSASRGAQLFCDHNGYDSGVCACGEVEASTVLAMKRGSGRTLNPRPFGWN